MVGRLALRPGTHVEPGTRRAGWVVEPIVRDNPLVSSTGSPSPDPFTTALENARRWRRQDPDPVTGAALEALIDEAGTDPASDQARELVALFDGRIAFGTAGLRAALGPGPNRMNRLVVRQTTVGLMQWLLERAESPLVVVGYDARHGSADFAADTAAVVASLGGRAELLPRPLPTPVLAHAVLHRSADAGVMITASHNPPADNGYKLYLADGIQLVAPADAQIAALIDRVAARPLPEIDPAHPAVVVLGDDIVGAHLDAAVAALVTDDRTVSTVYTAMHGVGGAHLLAAFDRGGFARPSVVESQFAPDPEFPTVAFPNPEEPGALDLALAQASAEGADLVIANDPDADRLALAVPSRDDPTVFVPLSGDQLGVLLADHLLEHTGGSDRMTSASIVSSRLLARVAAAAGVAHHETLTGFKWVARPIVDHPDQRLILGYEEALGYCVGDRVRDKDGISAALVAAEMVATARSRGETLWDRLDRLAIRHDVHLTGPVTVRLPGADGVARRTELLDELVASPPEVLGGSTLVEAEDLSSGRRLPPTPGIVLHYADGTRVIVRPSGTEPKLKAYLEVIEPVASPDDLDAAVLRATGRLSSYQEDLRRRFGV